MDPEVYGSENELTSRTPSVEDLESLPDKAVLELEPGEVSKYTVVRVGDAVPVPFASPRLLYRMKVNTQREKDRADVLFFREHYAHEINAR